MFSVTHHRPDGTVATYSGVEKALKVPVSMAPRVDEVLLTFAGKEGTDATMKLTDGKVFVMNEAGATVAQHRL